MKREFIVGSSQLDIQRYLRRIKATLIRMIPKQARDHRGGPTRFSTSRPEVLPCH
jgi:hypothetical protein